MEVSLRTDPAAATYNHFENVTHRRVNRGGNQFLPEIMFVGLTAAICGANEWADVESFACSKPTWFRHPISNDTSEGFNSRIQAIKANAHGFRNFANYKTRNPVLLRKTEPEAAPVLGSVSKHSI